MHVLIQLISKIKQGYRPVLPEYTPQPIAKIIKDCWHSNPTSRPRACDVTKDLETYLDGLGGESASQQNSTTILESIEMQCSLLGSHGFIAENDPSVSMPANESNINQLSSYKDCESPRSSINSEQVQNDADDFDNNMCESGNESENVCSQTRGIVDIAHIKAKLQIREVKEFQLDWIRAVSQGSDVVVVQPTGSGKSLCFVVPGLMFPGKIALAVEPALAVITNQVDSLQKKGIDVIALGNAARSGRKSANFRRVFDSTDTPGIAFCTPEYLFGSDSSDNHSGTPGLFSTVLEKKERFSMVAIDEAHKIFNRTSNFCTAFNSMKQLQCPMVAISVITMCRSCKVIIHTVRDVLF